MDALRAELKKVQFAAAVPALDVQVEQCESFISRSQRRLTELDKQRVAEEELLTEARARLERLRLEAEQCRAASSATPKCRQRVDTVAGPSRGVATCRNPSSSEVSPSVDGRWSTFIGQCSSIAHCQCPGRGTLVKLRDVERSGTRGLWHCCSLWQFGRTGRSNVGPDLSHDVPMNARSTLMSALTRGGASKEVCKEQGVQVRNVGMSDWRSIQSRPTRHQDPT